MHRSSPLKRTPFKRGEGPSMERKERPVAKQDKSCAHCGKPFQPRSMAHTVCTPRCLLAQIKAKEKAQKERAKVERAKDRATKEKNKTLPTLHKEARFWFNRWIRLRDAAEPCISCGAPPPDLSGMHAGRDAGHYRSVGSAGHLRYTEANVAAQCVHCNQYLAGNPVGYRKGLIERRGPDVVEALEDNNAPEKWTRDQVRAIRDDYKARCKALEKENKA
jgi:hypothetical protein